MQERLVRSLRTQCGFSLVEAAIVLVVIGIVLGAVLQGRSLIDNAEYKSFHRQLHEYRGAFNNFRDRYGGLPGDFQGANRRLGSTNPPAGSGGSGTIDDGPTCDGESNETCLAWQHLRAAGMIGGNPAVSGEQASPGHTYGGVVESFFTGNEGQGDSDFGHKLLITSVPIDVAIRLDRETDDEQCNGGRIRALNNCSDGDWPDTDTLSIVYAL